MNDDLITEILIAFQDVQYPGDTYLKNSSEGTEPFLLEQEFRGKTDWKTLEPSFLDQAPDGFSTALSFFSDEAFRFYLPAYLIADIKNQLHQVDMIFHLTFGLDNKSKAKHINPNRYADRTWFDEKTRRYSNFTDPQCEAVAHFLKFKSDNEEILEFEIASINQALQNFWQNRNTV